MGKKLYVISGLGSDHRLFFRVEPKGIELVHIPWLEPLSEIESLGHYALRMLQQIPERQGGLNLLGLSFGGIMAQEMARVAGVNKLILLSTLRATDPKPPLFRLFDAAPLYRLANRQRREKTALLWSWLFGAKGSTAAKFLLEMLGQFSDHYHNWAVKQISAWRPRYDFPEAIQTHGTRDQIFPHRYLRNVNHSLPGADQALVLTHATQLTRILEEIFEDD